jgi:hypothetical protein
VLLYYIILKLVLIYLIINYLRNHNGLNETLRSRLDSRQIAMAMRSRPSGHKIVISNLEPSVTSEDIRVCI